MKVETTTIEPPAALPESYRACILDNPGDDWALRSVPLKHPSAGEVLVKVICCRFCMTDADIQEGRLGLLVNWPAVPGHEFIGDVVEVGPGERTLAVGDRVGGSWHGGHDGTCRQCNQGFFQGCDNQLFNGASRHGSFAEYCNLRSDADPVATAAFLCAGVTIFNALRQLKVASGETVAVQGIGGLDHLGIQYARKMGYRVFAISTSDSKKELALQLGAHHYINSSATRVTDEIKKLGGAKMVIIMAPDPNAMGQYTSCLAWQGRLVILAPGDITLSSNNLVHMAAGVQGWHAGHALDCEDAIAFAHLHQIRCMAETFPFDRIQEAAEHLHNSKARFRVVLTMQ